MHDYIIAIILIPVYILLALLGRRLLKFAHGYEKGLEDAEKIRKMEEKRLLDELRAEIEQTSETTDGFLMHNGTKRTVLKIIDKYKADRSVKE